MKILTVVGARPQFIKAAVVSRALREHHQEILVHTGQHYDDALSDIFFSELRLPQPDCHLGVGSASHGAQTGAMLSALEPVVIEAQPDYLLVYGDTNTTLAGALVASKLHVPIIHIEAGVRSGNWRMPEEINRVLTDVAADVLLAPTQTAVANLSYEKVHGRVTWVGDVMLDVLQEYGPRADDRVIVDQLGLEHNRYYVATVHRAENTDEPMRLMGILEGLAALRFPVVVPLHPRTRHRFAAFSIDTGSAETIRWIDPVGYLDMMALVRSARAVVTDSGGLQKEAAFNGIPCVTLRDETEWPETVESGWNSLAGTDPDRITQAALGTPEADRWPLDELLRLFGGGMASQRVVAALAGKEITDEPFVIRLAENPT